MNSASRGVVLAIAAVLLGVIILGQGFDDPGVATADPAATATPSDDGTDTGADPGADSAAADDTSVDDTSTDGSADAGDDTSAGATDANADANADTAAADGADDGGAAGQPKPPADVRVLVANDTSTGGLGGQVANTLTAQSYATIGAVNATTQGDDPQAPSVVYFQQGYRPDAIAIATILGIAESAIAQLPDTPPVDDIGRANVLVVVGADLIPAA